MVKVQNALFCWNQPLQKRRWLMSCSYNPYLLLIDIHFFHIGKGLDSLSSNCDNNILMGDFNAELSNHFVDSFCGSYSFNSRIKKPTHFKNPDNTTWIDLILINRWKSFWNSTVIETGLSDFHKVTVTAVKSFFKKPKPKKLTYLDFKSSDKWINLTQSFR